MDGARLRENYRRHLMSGNLDCVNVEYLSGETRSEEVLSAVFISLWRRKWLIMAIIAASLVLGIIAVLVMPHRYMAEAYIRGDFFAASDAVAKDGEGLTAEQSISLDLGRIIETQSKLLQSRLLARRVVQQL